MWNQQIRPGVSAYLSHENKLVVCFDFELSNGTISMILYFLGTFVTVIMEAKIQSEEDRGHYITAACNSSDKCPEQQQYFYSAFIDFTKAFDTVTQWSLWAVMEMIPWAYRGIQTEEWRLVVHINSIYLFQYGLQLHTASFVCLLDDFWCRVESNKDVC